MLSFMINVGILTLIISLLQCAAYKQERNIVSKLNPGCTACANTTLVYIRAEGSHDTLHQIWDFTRGEPTVIFTVGSINSSLDIKWDGSEPQIFQFSEQPQYSFAVCIKEIYEYDDVKDVGYVESSAPHRSFSLRSLQWSLNDTVLTDKEALVRLTSGQIRGGWIEVMLDLLPFKDFAVDLPHLIHTSNTSLADITMVNLTSSPGYNNSRFALRLVIISEDPVAESMHYVMRKSLDDEHTPGVFEILEVKSPSCYSNGTGGFLQFRPVGYTQAEREVSSSTIAHASHLNRTLIPHRSTLSAFYRNFDVRNLVVQDMLISFGETGDGFYKQHNYTAWSFTIGYGSPPVEGFSLFVILVISFGLAVPVLLALSGLACVLRRRSRAR